MNLFADATIVSLGASPNNEQNILLSFFNKINLKIKNFKPKFKQEVRICGIESSIFGGKYHDGEGDAAEALLDSPDYCALDEDGNLFFSDYGNQIIRKISRNANSFQISTVVGIPKTSGFVEAESPTKCLLQHPRCLVFDSHGNLFFCDSSNHIIRKLEKFSGKLVTFAGTPKKKGYQDGEPHAALFNYPYAMCIDSYDTLYVVDKANVAIRRISPTGFVTTVLRHSPHLFLDGNNFYMAMNTDNNREIYISVAESMTIQKIELSAIGDAHNTASVLIGTFQKRGGHAVDDKAQVLAHKMLLNGPKGLYYHNHQLFFVDSNNKRIRKLDLKTMYVTTVQMEKQYPTNEMIAIVGDVNRNCFYYTAFHCIKMIS